MSNVLLDPVATILSSPLMTGNPSALNTMERLEVFEALKLMEGKVEERKEELRVLLLTLAKECGVKEEKSDSYKFTAEDETTVTNEYRRGKISEKRVVELITKKSIKQSDVFSEVKAVVVDESKLENLQKLGKVTEEEIKALYGETRALKVSPSDTLSEEIDALAPVLVEEKKPKKAKK